MLIYGTEHTEGVCVSVYLSQSMSVVGIGPSESLSARSSRTLLAENPYSNITDNASD